MSALERPDGARIRGTSESQGEPVVLVMGLAYPSDMWFRVAPVPARSQAVALDGRPRDAGRRSATRAGSPRARAAVGRVRRRQVPGPLAEVPQRLRAFDPGWLEVAAQGPDGYLEALMAVDSWLADRRRWKDEHGFRGDVVEWIRANSAARPRCVASVGSAATRG